MALERGSTGLPLHRFYLILVLEKIHRILKWICELDFLKSRELYNLNAFMMKDENSVLEK